MTTKPRIELLAELSEQRSRITELEVAARGHAAALAEANDRAEGLWVRHDTAQAELTRQRASNAALLGVVSLVIGSLNVDGASVRQIATNALAELCAAIPPNGLNGVDPPQNPPQLERSATLPEGVTIGRDGIIFRKQRDNREV